MSEAIHHPGPAAAERWQVVRARAHPLTVTLPGGARFGDAVAAALKAAGFEAGYLRLADVAMSRLDYVIPGPAPGDGRAAWYSDTRELGPGAVIRSAGVHLGRREGRAFTHCHGLWGREGDETAVMGHILPDDSVVAEDSVVIGWGLDGATFETVDDPETRFPLFSPREARTAGAADGGGQAAWLVRLAPNVDPAAAIAAIAEREGIGAARIEGIGSLVRPRFIDGGELDSYATEILIEAGQVADGHARIDARCVGFDGAHGEGMLAGGNAVCVTAEMLLIEDAPLRA